MEERERPKSGHKLTLTNRNLANITGVKDVISFDVKEILLETSRVCSPLRDRIFM